MAESFISKGRPGLSFLALDAEGLGRLSDNLLKLPQGGDMIAVDPLAIKGQEVKSFNIARIDNVIQYTAIDLAGLETVDLIFTVEQKGIRIKINRDIPHDYHTNDATPLRLLFDPSVTPPSPMGRLKGPVNYSSLFFFIFLIMEACWFVQKGPLHGCLVLGRVMKNNWGKIYLNGPIVITGITPMKCSLQCARVGNRFMTGRIRM